MWDRESDLVGERTLHVQLYSGKILDVEERDTEREMEAQREGGVHLPGHGTIV